jgi:hypothetical protein
MRIFGFDFPGFTFVAVFICTHTKHNLTSNLSNHHVIMTMKENKDLEIVIVMLLDFYYNIKNEFFI